MNTNAVNHGTKETTRLEAFSDGVFAIAITLLVLEIRVPEANEEVTLATQLLESWPSYLAYLISFLTIAVMWVNHHHLFRHIERIDNRLLFLNSLLLMVITFLNYSTAVLAAYIQHPEQRLAALFYAGTMVVIAILFNLLWLYASAKGRLLPQNADPVVIQSITYRYRFGPVMYLAAFVLVFVSVAASLALQLIMAVFFALTGSTITRLKDN